MRSPLLSLAAAAALCACGGSTNGWTYADPAPLAAPPRPTDPEDLPEPADPAGPAQTGPAIDLEALLEYEGPPAVRGLPARADDLLALPVVDGDGARGNPNLTLRLIRLPSGETVQEVVVLTAAQYAGADSPEALRPAVAARVSEARRLLEAAPYRPLTPVHLPETPSDEPVRASAAGVVLQFDPGTGALSLRDEASDAELLRRTVPGAPPTERGRACPRVHPPRLRAAFVDRPDGVLVLRVAFEGNDACWQPSDRWEVISLGPAGSGAGDGG